MRSSLKDALHTLPEREALIIQLYYMEELNMKLRSHGNYLDVSQIKSSAIKRQNILVIRNMVRSGMKDWRQTHEISMAVQTAEMRLNHAEVSESLFCNM